MKWETALLGSVCSKIGSGATPKGGSMVYTEQGISLIRSQNVYNLRFSYDGIVYINDEAARKLDGVAIKEGDILINITGDSVARTCIVPPNILPARVNQHVAIIRPNSDALDSRFLNYYLVTPYMQAKMLGLAVGKGASRNAMTKEMIENFLIPLPPLSIQNKIASILTAYDNLIENNQKRIKLLEQMAQRLYHEWFVRFRFPGYEKAKFVDGIPQGWEYGRLSEVLSLLDSKRIPLSSMERDTMEPNYPYYGAAGQLGFVEDYIFDGTYLLLGEDGSVITEDGYPYLQYVWGKFWVNNHAHIIEQRGNYSVEFLYCMFKKMNVQSIVTGVAQPKISQGRLFMKKVLLPSDIVLKVFNGKIQPLFSQIKVLTEQNKNLTKQRDLLLPRLMSGKLAV